MDFKQSALFSLQCSTEVLPKGKDNKKKNVLSTSPLYFAVYVIIPAFNCQPDFVLNNDEMVIQHSFMYLTIYMCGREEWDGVHMMERMEDEVT